MSVNIENWSEVTVKTSDVKWGQHAEAKTEAEMEARTRKH